MQRLLHWFYSARNHFHALNWATPKGLQKSSEDILLF